MREHFKTMLAAGERPEALISDHTRRTARNMFIVSAGAVLINTGAVDATDFELFKVRVPFASINIVLLLLLSGLGLSHWSNIADDDCTVATDKIIRSSAARDEEHEKHLEQINTVLQMKGYAIGWPNDGSVPPEKLPILKNHADDFDRKMTERDKVDRHNEAVMIAHRRLIYLGYYRVAVYAAFVIGFAACMHGLGNPPTVTP